MLVRLWNLKDGFLAKNQHAQRKSFLLQKTTEFVWFFFVKTFLSNFNSWTTLISKSMPNFCLWYSEKLTYYVLGSFGYDLKRAATHILPFITYCNNDEMQNGLIIWCYLSNPTYWKIGFKFLMDFAHILLGSYFTYRSYNCYNPHCSDRTVRI